jgi:hypothetical protein
MTTPPARCPLPAATATIPEPFDNQLAAERLRDHARHFDGQKFLLGLHCHWIKHQIPFGEFGPWLQKHAPHLCKLKDHRVPQPRSQLSEAMKFCAEAARRADLTIANLLENMGKIQIPGDRGFAHGGEFLLLTDGDLPAAAHELRAKVLTGIQKQLDFENRRPNRPPVTIAAATGAGAPAKKPSPTEQHALDVTGIREETAFVIGRLELWLNRPPLDKTEDETIDLRVLDALAKRLREDIQKTLDARKPGRKP